MCFCQCQFDPEYQNKDNILKNLIKESGISIPILSKKLGYKFPGYIYQILNNRVSLSIQMRGKILNALNQIMQERNESQYYTKLVLDPEKRKFLENLK